MRRSLNIREAQRTLSQCIHDAQDGVIVLTRHGHPVALLVGVEEEGKDAESHAELSEIAKKKLGRVAALPKKGQKRETRRRTCR